MFVPPKQSMHPFLLKVGGPRFPRNQQESPASLVGVFTQKKRSGKALTGPFYRAARGGVGLDSFPSKA
jgi:hypothetical protein